MKPENWNHRQRKVKDIKEEEAILVNIALDVTPTCRVNRLAENKMRLSYCNMFSHTFIERQN